MFYVCMICVFMCSIVMSIVCMSCCFGVINNNNNNNNKAVASLRTTQPSVSDNYVRVFVLGDSNLSV